MTAQKESFKDIDNLSYLDQRPSIEQEDLSFNDTQPLSKDFNPMQDLANKLDAQKSMPTPAKSDVNQFANLDQKSDKNETADTDDDMEKSYFSLLEQLGIQLKISDAAKKGKLFGINVDVMGGGSSNGFFIIPEYVDNERINQSKAQSIAKDFCQKFGVTKLTFQKVEGNYKFNFVIMPTDNKQMTNSSLDQLLGGKNKAAYSRNSFIKESKNSILNSLMKKGFGGKHAS